MVDDGCPRCGEAHKIVACPLVKAIELFEPGDFNSAIRIEFLTPADWPPPTRPAAEAPAPDYPRKVDA